MKTRVFVLLLCGSGILSADYGPPVLETTDEFFAYGDFDATGRRGYMVIDRASGGVRPVSTNAQDLPVMGIPVPSGVSGVTGVAVGRFKLTNRDALAVTSPETNRIKVVAQFGVLTDAWPAGIGPRDIVGLPLPVGTSGLHGLAAVSVANHPTSGAYRRNLMSNTSGTFASWVTQTPTIIQTPQRSLAVVRQPGDTALYAEVRSSLTDVVFAIHDSQTSSLPVLTSCSGLASGSRVCYGHFNPTHNRSVFVFHVPGTGNIQVVAMDPGLLLAAPVTHGLGVRMDWVYPATADDGMRLIGCQQGGSSLRIIRFSATDTPSQVQSLTAPAGQVWKGLLPAAGGGWFAASGLPGTPGSLAFQQYFYHDGQFVPGATFDLSPLRAEELGGDILLFAGRPFFDNSPVLRANLRAAGWTSNLAVGPAPSGTIETTRETWQGATQGLGASGTTFLGFTPTGVTHGLANQLSNDASFYSLDPPVGLLPDAIQFDPPGGTQTGAVSVSLTANDPATTIHYALNGTNRWTPYTAPIGPLTTDTTIQAYASDGTLKTPVSKATYTFPAYAGDLDSDGDGVPDFVEIQFGLSPSDSLGDADLDGVSDLLEILANSDPADAGDLPEAQQILAYTRRFDLTAEPKSHDGSAHGAKLTLLPCLDPVKPSRLLERTRVTLCRPDGSTEIEGDARIRQPTGEVALLASGRAVQDPPPFWVACTPDRFMIATPLGSELRHGRGVFRLLDYSAPPLYPLPKPALSGTAAEQTAQWAAAIRSHFAANTLVTAGGPVTYQETLDLLLAEHALGAIFHARRLIKSDKVTLTPARGDATGGRHVVNPAWIADLPLATAVDSGYDWQAMLAYIRSGQAGSQSRAGLNQLAREFYRIGYHAFDDPANPLNVSPFDALREYLDTGAVPSAYAPLLTVPGSVLSAAASYRAAFLASLPVRTHTAGSLTLVAEAGFERDPWLVLTAKGGTEYWLATPDSQPYPSPSGFRMIPGSRYLVSGHLAERAGGGQILMVDDISFLDAPVPPTVDADNNLLADSWEGFLFGTLGNNPFADTDGDGYSSLQEMFEWTDPDYATSAPAVPVVDLRPPRLFIEHFGGRNFALSWQWPTFYQDRIRFFVGGTVDFRDHLRIIDSVPGDSQGRYTTPVDASSHPPSYFYRAGMELK